jgi:hypothetical protein
MRLCRDHGEKATTQKGRKARELPPERGVAEGSLVSWSHPCHATAQ